MNRDSPKTFIEPPVIWLCLHRAAVAGDGVEIWALDYDLQISGNCAVDDEMITGFEAARGGKFVRNELVLELHSTVPGIPVKPIRFPHELIGQIKVNVGFRLASCADIHVIQREYIR